MLPSDAFMSFADSFPVKRILPFSGCLSATLYSGGASDAITAGSADETLVTIITAAIMAVTIFLEIFLTIRHSFRKNMVFPVTE